MDHIVGLGFFDALYRAGLEVHIWGPASTTLDLCGPPLPLPVAAAVPGAPARPRLPAHAARRAARDVRVPATSSSAARSSRIPGRPSGYRIEHDARCRHLPDRSRARARRRDVPRLGRVDVGLRSRARRRRADPRRAVRRRRVPRCGRAGATVRSRTPWPSRELAEVRHLVTFHHDPAHDDETLDRMYAATRRAGHPFAFTVAAEGLEIALPVRVP